MNNKKRLNLQMSLKSMKSKLKDSKKGLWTRTLSLKKNIYQHKILNLSVVNVDLEMDNMVGQQGNADDTDYDDSDELQSLVSDDEDNDTTTRRQHSTQTVIWKIQASELVKCLRVRRY
ncbi:hypothetical protein Adt_09303 [Abeliophyllum distichum]|uniref:Uncharacterized protein n=1 Tax=Abeliophyllum distichum TaxID=126358 RepID=A0ABD1UGT0_9LAMI